MTNPYAFGESTKKAYEEAGSFFLSIPEGALPKIKRVKVGSEKIPKDHLQWNEHLVLSDLTWDEPGPGFILSEPSDVTFALRFEWTVTPESQFLGNPSINQGRKVFENLNFNIPHAEREPRSSIGFQTNIAGGKLKQIMKALSLDTAIEGPKAFFDLYRDSIIGMKVWALMDHGPDRNDVERQQVDKYIKDTP